MALAGCRNPASDPELKLQLFPLAGEKRSYSFRYSSRSLSDIRPLFGDPDSAPAPGLVHTYRSEVEGQLDVEVLPNRQLQFWIVPSKVEFEADGNSEPTTIQNLLRELPRGARFEFDDRGRISLTTLPKDLNRVTMGLWQAVATRWQWPRPEGKDVRWEAKEPDVNGEMHVTCVLRPRADGGYEVERNRDTLTPSEDTGAESALATGQTKFRFQAGQGLPLEIRGEDRTELLRSGRPLGVSEETVFASALGEVPTLDQATANLRRSEPPYDLVLANGRVLGQHTRAEMERGRLAGRAPAVIWKAYKLESASIGGAKESYLALKAMLYLYPQECETAAELLLHFDRDVTGLSGVAEALADAGHADAQRALRSAMARLSPPSPGRAMVAGAIGALREPDRDTISLLQKVALESTPAADSAMLALGRLAHPKGKTQGSEGETIVLWLLEKYLDPSLGGRRPVIALALGNTASSLAEPQLIKAIGSPEPDLRGAAATSLRWMPSIQADLALRNALAKDPDLEVRRKAAGALSYRQNESNLAALISAAKDPSPGMRIAVLTVLGGWTHVDARIEACFRQAAADADPDVRRMAEALLAARPSVEFKVKSP